MQKPIEDRLNRRPFANDLARKLFNLPPDESRVVGVIGDWGVGKTTFLSYLAEASQDLPHKTEVSKPVVVYFNPWWFSGREDLILRFFNEMALTFGNVQNLQPIAKALRQVARGISATSSWFSVFGIPKPLLDLVGEAAHTIPPQMPSNRPLIV